MSEDLHTNPPVTEQENPRTRDIASLPAAEVVRLMNEEDARVAEAVRLVLPDVARAVEAIVERLGRGGRLFHVRTRSSASPLRAARPTPSARSNKRHGRGR